MLEETNENQHSTSSPSDGRYFYQPRIVCRREIESLRVALPTFGTKVLVGRRIVRVVVRKPDAELAHIELGNDVDDTTLGIHQRDLNVRLVVLLEELDEHLRETRLLHRKSSSLYIS